MKKLMTYEEWRKVHAVKSLILTTILLGLYLFFAYLLCWDPSISILLSFGGTLLVTWFVKSLRKV
jgi:predicted ferric reductase